MAKKLSGGTPATDALTAAGVAFELHAYEHDPSERHFGDETIAILGLDPQRVFKTLIVDVNPGGRPELAVGVVPVAGMLDLKAIAAALGAKKADLADPKDAERSSGYVVGGISPLGQRTPLPTVIDETALLFDTIFCSAGRRGLQVEVDAEALASVIGAVFADIAR
ncbi:Cys-tRNA(Pro) deacylase [Propioniciclava tarda]|uniref:Cys-tRNA(Pro)/Cys-tRNA(Cys) deacylase n=1 Tax=Propioniciclava tarda TaxID=433330 RepID=A0A4Q9KMQ4_PROTD|nr:Cys-tRNA(Pro) deacylase [Propioniciclava tarda]TBT95832.1 Cys-tRNA(Pro) deacylase [Propioniciclava tarda]SMO40343.1 Cys-tRNA(Pro)/Cys-tRNA(Cys) deacylase [Propioniciclava tarda]HOA90039.1 Cys-tRNA(Pro) deacylase [Propioniciclava tarda]HQA30734.1 Cys-tRNA(Pro) deacylase [Propioniciclava tarda]